MERTLEETTPRFEDPQKDIEFVARETNEYKEEADRLKADKAKDVLHRKKSAVPYALPSHSKQNIQTPEVNQESATLEATKQMIASKTKESPLQKGA